MSLNSALFRTECKLIIYFSDNVCRNFVHTRISSTTRFSSTLVFRRFYVTRTAASNHIILEKQAVNMFILAFLRTVDFFQLLTFCDFKKMRIQKLLNRVEKYRWIFLWTSRHKGKWFFCNVKFYSRLLFLWHVLRIVEIRVVWRRGSWVRVIQLCKERHKIEVQTGCIFY